MRRRTEPTIDIRQDHDPEVSASLYLTGELPRRALRWFEHHLLECEDCWREVWLARRGRFLFEHARYQAPATLRDSIRANIQITAGAETNEPKRRIGRRRKGPR